MAVITGLADGADLDPVGQVQRRDGAVVELAAGPQPGVTLTARLA